MELFGNLFDASHGPVGRWMDQLSRTDQAASIPQEDRCKKCNGTGYRGLLACLACGRRGRTLIGR